MSLKQRLKSLAAALALAASLWTTSTVPVLAAGTTPLSLAIQYDTSGNLASGCLLNFYVAGTVATLQNAYADFGLTTPLSNPIQCDQSGRVPQHWLADGLIHIVLTTSSGNPIVDTTMQVLGPSSGGGGGGGTVDPTSVMATGDLKVKYQTGALAGFVRTNGLTVGNATSGATERANADTQALFIFLYNGGDATLVVSGGRTGNALNDFNSGKTITVPNYSGRALAALDNQGAGANGILTTGFYGTSPAVLGAAGGVQSHTQSLSEVAVGITVSGSNPISVSGSNSFTAAGANTISSSGLNSISVSSTVGSWVNSGGNPLSSFAPGGGGCCNYITGAAGFVGAVASTNPSQAINVTATPTINVAGSVSISSTGTNTITGTSTNTGGSPFATVSPLKLATIYIKL